MKKVLFLILSTACAITQPSSAQQITRPSPIVQIKKGDGSMPLPLKTFSGSFLEEVGEKRDFKKRSIRKTPEINVTQDENHIASPAPTENQPCLLPPLVGTGFEGNRQTPFFLLPIGYYASECNVAISNAGKIVSISNGWMYYFDENGTLVFSDSLYHFGNSLIDCHVVYDPKKDRFVFVSAYGLTDFTSIFQLYGIVVAFSKTNNPLNGWNYYYIPDTKFNDQSIGDYPLLAISDAEVFITYTYFNPGDVPKHSLIIQLDKDAGYAGAASLNSQTFQVPYTANIKGNVIPAQGGSTTYGPNMYFMMAKENGSSNKYVVYEVTNTISSGNALLLSHGLVESNLTYLAPGPVYQPGGLELLNVTVDHAFVQNAFYENGIIQFCQQTKVNGKSAVYHGRIGGIPNSLYCTAKTISDPNLYLSYSSIVYAGKSATDQSAILGIQHTSSNTYPGLSSAFISSNFNVSSLVTVKSGLDTINGLWGDYSGICKRYNRENEFWFEGQYGSTTFPNINWIAKLTRPACAEDLANVSLTTQDVTANFLLTVYPNPMASQLIISFTLPESQNDDVLPVSLKVFDMNGRLVKELVNTGLQPGEHQLEWNADNEKGQRIADGNYLLRLDAAHKSSSKIISVIH